MILFTVVIVSIVLIPDTKATELKYELLNQNSLKDCKCNFTLDLTPVCENRKVNYDRTEMADCINKCLKQSTHIYIVHTSMCSEKCNCILTDEFSPVCGNNGVNYPNPAYLTCISKCKKPELELLHCGFCPNTTATINNTFDPISKNQNNVPQDLLRTLRRCKCAASNQWHPICGNDGITYPNLEMMQCVKKCKNSDLRMEHCGKCSTVAYEPSTVLEKQTMSQFSEETQKCFSNCPRIVNVDSICGSDGRTYESSSQMICFNRCTNGSVVLKHRGACKETCDCKVTDDVDPVCGSDERTYVNGATLFCAKKCKQSDLRLLHCGPCIKEASKVYKLSGYISKRYGCITTEEYEPVCGSNGVIYNNPSYFYCSTTSSNPDLYIRRCGLCKQKMEESKIKSLQIDGRQTKTLEDPFIKHDCVATATLHPVCGTDGKTYPHPSYLYCLKDSKTKDKSYQDLHISYCGACGDGNLKSKNFEYQEVEVSPEYMDTFKKCNCSISKEFFPVCATDQVTYENPSIFFCTKKCMSKEIHIKHCGACKDKTEEIPLAIDSLNEYSNNDCKCHATREYKPICGEDGVNYSNKDVFDCANKCLNGSLKIAYDGLCGEQDPSPSTRQARSSPEASVYYAPKECSSCKIVHENVRPMCGTDNRTYASNTHLRCINKCRNTDVRMAYTGHCIESSTVNSLFNLIPPTPIGILQGCRCIIKKDGSQPFCGTDGHTYLNPSHASCMSVCKDKTVVKAHDGPCTQKKCPCFISAEPHLLCGSDGRTYANPSALECVNRCNQRSVSKAYDGRCRTERTLKDFHNLE